MTSRELTSGFKFWSRGHLCMSVVHLPMKFGVDIVIKSRVIHIFRKLKMVASAILDLFGWAMGPPIVVRTFWNNLATLYGFEFFVVQAWKSYSRPQNFSFCGILPPKFRGTSFRPPKGTSLSGTTRFDPSLIHIWLIVRPVALANKKKTRKKDSGKLAIRPDHSRRRIEVKVCMPGGLWCVALYIKFYYKWSIGFATVGGRKLPFPITLAIGLYNSLYYCTSLD